MTEKDINKKEVEETSIKHPFDKYFRTVGSPEDVSNIAKAIQQVYPYMRNLEKSGYNDFHNYEYIPIDEIVGELNNAISEKIDDDVPNITIFTTIMDHKTVSSGKFTDCIVKILITFMNTETGAMIQTMSRGIGRDKSEKHMFKAITNAFKYAIKYTFLIAEGGGDPEADSYMNNESNSKDYDKKASNFDKTKKKSKSKPKTKPSTGKPDKEEELNKVKKLFSKNKKIVQKESKRVLKDNGYEGKKISELKKLTAEQLKDLNESIESKLD